MISSDEDLDEDGSWEWPHVELSEEIIHKNAAVGNTNDFEIIDHTERDGEVTDTLSLGITDIFQFDGLAPEAYYKLYMEQVDGKFYCCDAQKVLGGDAKQGEGKENETPQDYRSMKLQQFTQLTWKVKTDVIVYNFNLYHNSIKKSYHLSDLKNFQFLTNWELDLSDSTLTISEIQYICRSYFVFCKLCKKEPKLTGNDDEIEKEKEHILAYIEALNLTFFSPWKSAALQIISEVKKNHPYIRQYDYILKIIECIKQKEYCFYKNDCKQFLEMFQSLSELSPQLYDKDDVKRILTTGDPNCLTEGEFDKLLKNVGYSRHDTLIDIGYLITFLHP